MLDSSHLCFILVFHQKSLKKFTIKHERSNFPPSAQSLCELVGEDQKARGTNQQKPQTADMNPNSDAKSSSLQPLFTIHITLETIGNLKTLALAEGKIMIST